MTKSQFINYCKWTATAFKEKPIAIGISLFVISIKQTNKTNGLRLDLTPPFRSKSYFLHWYEGDIRFHEADVLPHGRHSGLEAIHAFEKLIGIDFSGEMGIELLLNSDDDDDDDDEGSV